MNELLNELYYTLEEKKKLEAKEKELKDQIERQMVELSKSKIENDCLKITLVPETISTSFDTTTFKKKEPDLYEDLLKDYHKETSRKAYLKVTVI